MNGLAIDGRQGHCSRSEDAEPTGRHFVHMTSVPPFPVGPQEGKVPILFCDNNIFPEPMSTGRKQKCSLMRELGYWLQISYVAGFVTSSSPVPLKTRRVGQRCTLNLSRAETSSRWRGVVVRRGDASSGFVHVT
ncbi:uncharacterized protein TNCV_2061611 [Trichonephila clavipes]|nr:uncharacterized protein TNCV_2061611 [Trichonephila clavipes]